MATFLVAHGAWSAGWAWKKMRPLLRERGHELFTPSHTGLGERAHLLSREIDLETHIADILGVIRCEDLREVTLIGHSYGGMVATGVADRASERLSRLVYLDAFAPRDGQSLLDLLGPQGRAERLEDARRNGEGWLLSANPMPADTTEADQAWAMPRRGKQPLKTFDQPVRLTGAVDRLPRSYIYCTRTSPGDPFRPFAERARRESGWQCFDLDASHSPHITAPRALADLLEKIVGTPAPAS